MVKEDDCVNCPICDHEALEGGLMADSLFINWVSKEEIEKNSLKELVRITYPGVCISNNQLPIIKRAKVPNAYLCPNCQKVFGIFDVTDDYSRP